MIIVEFESATTSGNQIYTLNTMHGLKTGQRFPCSGGTSTNHPPTCIIERGEVDNTSKFSKPIRVYITDFSYTASPAGTFAIYLVVDNPKDIDSDMSINIKLLEGTNW